jgi:hypothetical protein
MELSLPVGRDIDRPITREIGHLAGVPTGAGNESGSVQDLPLRRKRPVAET